MPSAFTTMEASEGTGLKTVDDVIRTSTSAASRPALASASFARETITILASSAAESRSFLG